MESKWSIKKRIFRKLITNCMSGWQLLTKNPLPTVYPILLKKSIANRNYCEKGERALQAVRIAQPAWKCNYCVPRRKYISLSRKTKSGNGQVLNVKSAESPQPTSKTLLDGITAIDSIPDLCEKVNSQHEKNSDTRYASPSKPPVIADRRMPLKNIYMQLGQKKMERFLCPKATRLLAKLAHILTYAPLSV